MRWSKVNSTCVRARGHARVRSCDVVFLIELNGSTPIVIGLLESGERHYVVKIIQCETHAVFVVRDPFHPI